jgi:predicted O-methyltransferase YrrM
MDRSFYIQQYLSYRLKGKTEYYLHSPFAYDYYMKVLNDKAEYNYYKPAEALRNNMLLSNAEVFIEDFGTGTDRKEKVSTITKRVAISPKYGRLIARTVQYFAPHNIIELGTHLGLSTCYLGAATANTLKSIEGSKELHALAKTNIAQSGLNNIELLNGRFEDILPSVLNKLGKAGLIFFDGNHASAPTLQYFNQCLEYVDENTIMIFDDIYWSRDMAQAWQTIKAHPRVTITFDLFRMGLVFFRKEKLAKEDFMLLF